MVGRKTITSPPQTADLLMRLTADFPDFLQGLARPGEQNVTVANARVCSPHAVMADAGLALSDEEFVSRVEVAVADAWNPTLNVSSALGCRHVALRKTPNLTKSTGFPMLRHLTQPFPSRGSIGRVCLDARHHASGAPSSICRSNACRMRLMT